MMQRRGVKFVLIPKHAKMVDQKVREIPAGLLSEFMLGTIPNEEYERMYPESESDSSIFEI